MLVAQTVKNLPAMQEAWVQFLGQEDPLEKGMATHSSILAWRIPWTEEPGCLQSVGLQRVRHDWACMALQYFRHYFQPLAGNSDTTEATQQASTHGGRGAGPLATLAHLFNRSFPRRSAVGEDTPNTCTTVDFLEGVRACGHLSACVCMHVPSSALPL